MASCHGSIPVTSRDSGVMFLGQSSHSHENKSSAMLWGIFFKFGANIHWVPWMNWLDFGDQRSSRCDLIKGFFSPNSRIHSSNAKCIFTDTVHILYGSMVVIHLSGLFPHIQVEGAVTRAYNRWTEDLTSLPEYQAALQAEKEKWEDVQEKYAEQRVWHFFFNQVKN